MPEGDVPDISNELDGVGSTMSLNIMNSQGQQDKRRNHINKNKT